MMNINKILSEFEKNHRHPTNRLIHLVTIPLIVFSTIALAWLVNFGLLGTEGWPGRWINLATIAGPLLGLFYLRLSIKCLVGMAMLFSISMIGILVLEAAGLPLFPIALLLWMTSWVIQIWGHHIEGANPSFTEDKVFSLIGPLYVLDKLGFQLRRNMHSM